jgi:hypothetical protein
MAQNFSINTNWDFTVPARERIKDMIDGLRLPSLPINILPVVGDLVSFPGLEAFTFVVIAREFQYQDSAHLGVRYLLDIAHEDEQRKTLQLVHSAPAPGE